MVTVTAPAKINLTLEVLGRRSDGFHEICSILQTIDLCDILHIKVGQGVSFECDSPGWSAEKSLVSRAVSLLSEATGCSLGVEIKIEKRIPLLSGLGGDSSDAAALLRGLNELWGLGLQQERLVGLASKLGSDVAFFVCGGTALAEGRGEIITPLPPLAKMWVVLVVPDVPVESGKTGQMYAAIKPSHFTDGAITEKLAETLRKGGKFSPSKLFNTFENIAFDEYNMRKVYLEHIVKLGAPHVHLTGSGTALFTMFSGKTGAEDLYTRCKNQGMKVYMASTV
jgi:4-diphosphocytidyl-2-C-methyl-D-erythritol kinase